MPEYHLYVKLDGRWMFTETIIAADHRAALRKASASLKPEHYDKQIRLEQADPPPAPEPAAKRRRAPKR